MNQHPPVTHIVQTPKKTRTIEINATPEVIATLLRLGWTVLEDRLKGAKPNERNE